MDIELFKDAIAIISGIPDKHVRLDSWQDRTGRKGPLKPLRIIENSDEIKCNTLACAAGWLSLHPAMQALGLHPDRESGGEPVFGFHDGYYALADFFGITRNEAIELFGARDPLDASMYGEDLTDKELWLRRAHFLLAKYQIKWTR
jgi:hypothetical protein